MSRVKAFVIAAVVLVIVGLLQDWAFPGLVADMALTGIVFHYLLDH